VADSRPVLLVVTGHPATGKTTLARELAEELGWRLVEKDTIKERLFVALGTGDRAWSKELGKRAILELLDEVEAELAEGRSVVAEANFEPITDFRSILERTGARCVQVVTHAPPDVIMRRFRRRERHPGHLDDEMVEELEQRVAEPYRPLDLPGPLIEMQDDA
jgi:predicted kinase